MFFSSHFTISVSYLQSRRKLLNICRYLGLKPLWRVFFLRNNSQGSAYEASLVCWPSLFLLGIFQRLQIQGVVHHEIRLWCFLLPCLKNLSFKDTVSWPCQKISCRHFMSAFSLFIYSCNPVFILKTFFIPVFIFKTFLIPCLYLRPNILRFMVA